MRVWRVWKIIGVILVTAGCGAGCGGRATEPAVFLTTAPAQVSSYSATSTLEPTTERAVPNHAPTDPGATLTAVPSPPLTHTLAPATPTFDPQTWVDLPVIPAFSPRAVEILRDGLAKGNNPRAFSKIGDCESQASWFLENFDRDAQYYSLGAYEAELSPVVAYYNGSFKRVSLAARQGFTSASLMAPLWANKELCEKNEGPLACEYRLQRPSMAFVMLGTNDASNPKTFEGHMRKIIEYSIRQGVLPVLGTKADNVEKDHFINATIARLGAEYGVPVWNFWAALQDLPKKGLQEDGVHLTFGNTRFNDPANMKNAWPVRNLNALQILKLVMENTTGK